MSAWRSARNAREGGTRRRTAATSHHRPHQRLKQGTDNTRARTRAVLRTKAPIVVGTEAANDEGWAVLHVVVVDVLAVAVGCYAVMSPACVELGEHPRRLVFAVDGRAVYRLADLTINSNGTGHKHQHRHQNWERSRYSVGWQSRTHA